MSDDLATAVANSGCSWEAEGRFVVGALILLKTMDDDGEIGVSVIPGDGIDWVTRLGMLRAAITSEESDLGSESTP